LFSKQGDPLEQRTQHLFTLTDFLDDSWTHRSYWEFASEPSLSTGCSGRKRGLIYGRLLLYDDSMVYGYGRKDVHWSNQFQDGPYRLFARRQDAEQERWSKSLPIRVLAMVKAGETLWLAGPEERRVVRRSSPVRRPRRGHAEPKEMQLLACSPEDGEVLARYAIPAAPVFDSLAAARGQLFLTLKNGNVICLGAP
jgi:hypothetical protein